MKSILSKLVIICGCSIFIFGKCNKDDDNPVTPVTDYSPLTTGSSWTYLNTPGGTSVLTVSSRDTVALGRTYKVLTNSNGANNYLAKTGDSCYRFGILPGVGNIEELYLKSNLAVNGTWSITQDFTYMGLTIKATIVYTIKEKGIERTVSGKVYKNVIHVRMDLSAPIVNNIGGGDFYYAAGIGLIDANVLVTPPGQTPISQVQVLTASDIK